MKRKGTDGMYNYHTSIDVYKRLTKLEAAAINKETRVLIKRAFKPGCGANKAIMTYLGRSNKRLKHDDQSYIFYQAPQNSNHRPPYHICSISSIMEGIIKIVDHYT
jgi:hypothetical protein